MDFLEIDCIYHGLAEALLPNLREQSIALSFWSPPYFVGKEYEKDATYESWQALLMTVIQAHARILKPGGFLVINIANILCFKDETIPRFQALNLSQQRVEITLRNGPGSESEIPALQS